MDVHSCHLLFDYFQFASIHEPNIPGSYAILLFTALDLASITSHIHNWVLFLLWLCTSFFLEFFLHWSPVAYCAPTNMGSSSLSVLSFCLFILFMNSMNSIQPDRGLQKSNPIWFFITVAVWIKKNTNSKFLSESFNFLKKSSSLIRAITLINLEYNVNDCVHLIPRNPWCCIF